MITLKNRAVEIEGVDGVDPRDYPDFCDAYISNAYWEDTGAELTDEELELLRDENPEFFLELCYNSLF